MTCRLIDVMQIRGLKKMVDKINIFVIFEQLVPYHPRISIHNNSIISTRQCALYNNITKMM